MVVIRVVASPCIDPRGASPLFPVARGARVAISCAWARWQAAAISPRTSDAKLALKHCDRKGSLKSPEPIANPMERTAINTNQPVWDRGFLSRSLMANSAYSSAREDALAALADWSLRDARALAAALERARIAAVRVRSISESGMASAEASFCASNLHNKAADKTTPLRDNRVRRRSRARHIADRSTRPVQSLDDRHGVAPILCRRTLRPRHDAFSLPSSAIDRCPRCFSRWSRSSPRRAYPTHGGPAEQSARRSRSSASVGVVALVLNGEPPAVPHPSRIFDAEPLALPMKRFAANRR